MSVDGFAPLIRNLTALAAMEGRHAGADIVKKHAERIADEMRGRLGHYQEGWPPLAVATQAARVRAGYTADDPLLRSGQMQDDITSMRDPAPDPGTVSYLAGIPPDAPSAGYARAQDQGTIAIGGSIPPRPFVVPSAEACKDDYVRDVKDLMRVTLAG